MIVTNASERTQWFHFPIFTKNDKFSVTVDWNHTFEELDNLLEAFKIKLDSVESKENKLSSDFEQIQEEMLELKSIVTDYTYFFNDLKKEFADLRSNQLQLAATVKALVNEDLPARVNDLDARVTALENE